MDKVVIPVSGSVLAIISGNANTISIEYCDLIVDEVVKDVTVVPEVVHTPEGVEVRFVIPNI